MARYIMLWEYNVDHCPIDAKEKVNQWLTMADEIKTMLKSGQIKEYAHYAGEPKGYVIVEGNETDMLRLADTYVPYVTFTAKTLLSIEQCEQVWKSLQG